jgi:hypothetical protein
VLGILGSCRQSTNLSYLTCEIKSTERTELNVVALVFREEKFCGSIAGGRKASDAATRLKFSVKYKVARRIYIQIKRSSFRLFSVHIHGRSLLRDTTTGQLRSQPTQLVLGQTKATDYPHGANSNSI